MHLDLFNVQSYGNMWKDKYNNPKNLFFPQREMGTAVKCWEGAIGSRILNVMFE